MNQVVEMTVTTTGRQYALKDGTLVKMIAVQTLDIEVGINGTKITSSPRMGMEVQWMHEICTLREHLGMHPFGLHVEATLGGDE